MATKHTYYIAARDQCLGDRADIDALCAELKRVWNEKAAGATPTIVDGVSAWLDDTSNVQIRIIRDATASPITDSELSGRILPLLRD
jgi:hypothetical protein